MAKTVQTFDFEQCRAFMSELFSKTSLTVTQEQLDQLTTLIEMLNTWNAALNLTAIKDVESMVILHILDSAVLAPVLDNLQEQQKLEAIADVGTGAGFPGLVLAILRPQWNYTLVDSVGKKLSFVRQVVSKLGLKNVELINKRCEQIQHEPFDCIVSRAFAPLERMVNWCLPLLHPQGRFVAMKANLEDSEIQEVPKTVKISTIVDLHVPNLDAKRQAVILQHNDTGEH